MPDEIVDRLDKLIAAINTKGAPSMWRIEEIAAWFRLSEASARNIVARPDFPIAVTPTGSEGGGTTQRRWFSDEVIEWARVNRGTLPKARTGRRREAV